MIYRLVNPSDGVLFEGDDDKIAFVACLLVSNGAYAMVSLEDGRQVCSILAFGGDPEEDMKKAGVYPIKGFTIEHKKEVAAFLRTIFYGRSAADLDAFKAATADLPEAERLEAKRKHNNEHRSSLNNLEARSLWLAEEVEAMK